MSDGYAVSRRFKNRLRCWAHPVRKATFLTTGPDPRAQQFGEAGLELLERLMEAVDQAREGAPVDLAVNYAGQRQTLSSDSANSTATRLASRPAPWRVSFFWIGRLSSRCLLTRIYR